MNRLKEVRARRQVTQWDLALSVKMFPSRLSLIEREYIAPRQDEVRKLSRALGVTPEELFPEAK